MKIQSELYSNIENLRIKSLRDNKLVLEQMEVANTMYYNDFSLKLIEDALYELSRAKLSMGERYFVIRTGEMGKLSA